MAIISMKALLESGVHFGHRTHKWNPNMKPYIFTERNGIHIINLQLTVKAIEAAYSVVRDTTAAGGTILFVGTKRQAQETIQDEAARCNMPYVTARWLGGFLTNWRTIRESITELERLERMRESGDFEKLKKKEVLMLTRKMEKLETRLGGIRHMVGLPDLIFIVDVRREETAIHEANLLDIPVVAMVDTNCDPRDVDHVVPSNDDAIRAIKLIVGKMADAVIEGKNMRKDEEEEVATASGTQPKVVTTDESVSVETDAEVDDAELLGAATLAKMKADEEAAAAAEAAKAEAAEEAAEATEETADEEAAETEVVAEEKAEAPEAAVAETTEEVAEKEKEEKTEEAVAETEASEEEKEA